MTIEDLERSCKRILSAPRRYLPWVLLALLLFGAASLFEEWLPRFVFRDGDAPPIVVLDSRLAQVLRERTDLARSLGAPTADPVACTAVVQPFEGGFMIWTTEEPDAYLACFNEPERTCRFYSVATLGLGALASFEALPRPVQDLFNPIGGFRTTWIHNHLQDDLGLPLVAERGFPVVLQRFDRGILIRDFPVFRREDNQFLLLRETQPVLAVLFRAKEPASWQFVGKYGA